MTWLLTWLPPVHLFLSVIILVWDVVLAGRIAQHRQAPRAFAAISGLAGLLLLPALLVHLATATAITGRAVQQTDWIWPAVLVLFALQALYAVTRRLVNPLWGLPIATYNVLIAVLAVVRYLVSNGATPPTPLVALLSSQSIVMSFVAGSLGMAGPFFLNLPLVAPAYPALRPLTASFRAFMATLALIWPILIIVLGLPRAIDAARSIDRFGDDRLRERPRGDFAVGVKILPDASAPPSQLATRRDLELVDSVDARAIGVVIVPGAGQLTVDSVARVLERVRDSSTTVIVSIGYRGKLLPARGTGVLDTDARLRTVRYVVERIRPDIILPAEDPYGVGRRVIGPLSAANWQQYLTRAASTAKSVDRTVKVGVSLSRFGTDDSTLYAWAAASGSPIDVVGFSLFASLGGVQTVDAYQNAADRWMSTIPAVKDHWVFAAGGYPLAYGEAMQERAIWHTLAWATNRPAIKGAIIYEAGDYGQARGLRAPDGRFRAAALAVRRAIIGLRESVAP